MKFVALFAGVLSVVACGGSGSGGRSPSPSSPTPGQLSVGGNYVVQKIFLQNSCDDLSQNLTLTVTVNHTPGASTFTLQEGFGTYRGTISPDGRFEAEQLAPEHTPPLRMTLRDGRFTTTGLEASNVWEKFEAGIWPQPSTCSGTLSYRGTRTSGTNAFP